MYKKLRFRVFVCAAMAMAFGTAMAAPVCFNPFMDSKVSSMRWLVDGLATGRVDVVILNYCGSSMNARIHSTCIYPA